jgi:hypothetical protein
MELDFTEFAFTEFVFMTNALPRRFTGVLRYEYLGYGITDVGPLLILKASISV